MNIGIDTRTLQIQSRYHGIGQYVRQLVIHLLQRAADEDHFVFFKTKKLPWGLEHVRGSYSFVDVIRPGTYGRLSELWDWGLGFLDYRRERLDCLHIPSIHYLSFNYPCPVVLTIHDLIPLVFPDQYQKTGMKHRILYRLATKADHVIAVSHHTKMDAVRLLGIPEERISVIYEAADPSCRPVQEPRLVEETVGRYGIHGDYILYVGGFDFYDPRKRLGLLLDAFALLAASRKEKVTLVLCGKLGGYGERVKKEVERRGLTSSVRCTDYIPADRLPLFYSGARMFVFPSAYEGFGLPLVEAMACGTPTIAFKNSSIPEVVGEGGILLDSDDPRSLMEAMQAVLSSRAYAEALRQRALKQAGMFSWERTAAQTLEVYRRVAREERGRGARRKGGFWKGISGRGRGNDS